LIVSPSAFVTNGPHSRSKRLARQIFTDRFPAQT
jgi:hypothetical protein